MRSGICKLEFLVRSKSDFVHGIEVRGNAEFRLRTRQALALLFPLEQFQIIRANLSIIRQGRRSGMKAWAAKPTFLVGKPTWSHSPAWYAGAIAHDAYHAELYSSAKQRRCFWRSAPMRRSSTTSIAARKIQLIKGTTRGGAVG